MHTLYGNGAVSTEWAHGQCDWCGFIGPVREIADGTAPHYAPHIERHPLACKTCIPCTPSETVAERAYWHTYGHTYPASFRRKYK